MKNYFAAHLMAAGTLVLLLAGAAISQDTIADTASSTATATAATTVAPADADKTTAATMPSTPKAPVKRSAYDSDKWHVDISPYLWLAGISGDIRVGTNTVNIDKVSGGGLTSQLDFAFATRFEIRKGKLGVLLDENYLNLTATGTGPLGVGKTDVQPTYNMFEAGVAYELYSSPNHNSSGSDPLPPVFSLDVLGGIRYTHLGVALTRPLFSAEGSRNIVDGFAGNRIQVRPVPRFTLSGQYTVGAGGSHFSWTASGTADYRIWKPFSVWGGYQAYGINNEKNGKVVAFDGTIRGLLAGVTIHL